jgi:GNAT superfamily N-acetyltransferase
MDPRYRIRPARRDDLARFPAIEESADILFRMHAPDLPQPDGFVPSEAYEPLLTNGVIRVAVSRVDDQPVGFAAAGGLDGMLYLHEMSVHAEHQRRGLGSELLAAIVAQAARGPYSTVALTTDRFLPWNKPFYQRHGFIELDDASMPAALAAKLAEEVALGFSAARRCAMARSL